MVCDIRLSVHPFTLLETLVWSMIFTLKFPQKLRISQPCLSWKVIQLLIVVAHIYIHIYIYIHIVTGRAPSDKTKTTFKWESQLLMDVLTLSTPDRPTAKQSLVLACTNLSCRGFELLLPTGLASPK